MKKDIILILDGGCMRGVFNAGVASQFIKNGVYERIHSIYAISAGAYNTAFFITRDYKKGSSVYWEDLINGSFIYNNRLIHIFKLILRLLKNEIALDTSINVDYVVNVLKTNKKLDVNKVLSSDIKFFVKVFNVKKEKEEYLNAKENIFEKLRASSALPPFYPKRVKIKDMSYFDGNTISPTIDLYIKDLIIKNKDKKFIFISNTLAKGIGAFIKNIEDLFLGFLILCYFGKIFVINKTFNKIKYNQLKEYAKFSNLYIISPDYYMLPFCENKKEILKLYKHGIEKAKKFSFDNKIN
ncbi:MAG: patatin-like phospholipase family protein [Patescibacteria group bacterium]|nr:patatin-like phospholipase family protein [Patescibacteria group bacterium]